MGTRDAVLASFMALSPATCGSILHGVASLSIPGRDTKADGIAQRLVTWPTKAQTCSHIGGLRCKIIRDFIYNLQMNYTDPLSSSKDIIEDTVRCAEERLSEGEGVHLVRMRMELGIVKAMSFTDNGDLKSWLEQVRDEVHSSSSGDDLKRIAFKLSEVVRDAAAR